MKEIRLTQGKVALVDDADYAYLIGCKWYAINRYGDVWHAYTPVKHTITGKQTTLYIHRLIMIATPSQEIDHKNGNGLDNRRSNLRIVTRRQNQQNQRPQRNASSIYKGVSWDKSTGKWIAIIKADGKQYNLGRFRDEIKAATVYDNAARYYFGEFAYLNFP